MVHRRILNGNSAGQWPAPPVPPVLPPLPPEPPPAERSFLEILWRGRWSVGLALAVCLAAGVAYLLLAHPEYTSEAKLAIDSARPSPLHDPTAVPLENNSYLYTQAETIRSSPVLSEALQALPPELSRTWSGVDDPLGYLKKYLRVEVGKKDELVTIGFDSPYPKEAAAVVQSVVEAYLKAQGRQGVASSGELLRILTEERVKREADLSRQMKDLLDFKRANALFSMEEGSKHNLTMDRFAVLSDALTKAQLDAIDANARYGAAKSLMDTPGKVREFAAAQHVAGSSPSEDRALENLRAEQTRLESQIAGMTKSVGPGHPSVRALQGSLTQVQTRIAEQEKAYAEAWLSVLERERAAAQQRLTDVQAQYDAQHKIAVELNAKAADFAKLESDVKRTERLVDQLDERMKELRVSENTGALNIRIVEPAAVPRKPSKPAKKETLALAAVAGLVLGSALALVRDKRDVGMRSAEDVQAAVGLPVLGVVPHMGAGRSAALNGRAVHLRSLSEAAESFRSIRTALYFGVRPAQAKTILITSPMPGEGKSTFTSNLGIAMAKAGRRVLLVDADVRHPVQHEIFGVDGRVGLTDCLSDQAKWGQAVQPTQIAGLDMLPGGSAVEDASHLLEGDRLVQLLREAAGVYDFVLVDSPPVVPVPDAQLLAALCDLTLLVVRAERSTARLSRYARDNLVHAGADILGVVVNAAPGKKGKYAYYYSGAGHRRALTAVVRAEPPARGKDDTLGSVAGQGTCGAEGRGRQV